MKKSSTILSLIFNVLKAHIDKTVRYFYYLRCKIDTVKKSSFIIALILFGIAFTNAQKSIAGKIVLSKNDDKAFVVRNTKVMLRNGEKLDSTAVNEDLTFAFAGIDAKSVVLYLKSPIISPHAVTKVNLKKNKPTKVSLDYEDLHELTLNHGRQNRERDDDEDFEHVAAALIILRTIADIIFIFRH